MYDLTLNIDTDESRSSYIRPGIQENLRFERPDGKYPFVYEKSKNNSEFLAFHMMNPEGQTFVHTEFIPSSPDPVILAKKTANLVKRIRHIGKKIVDENLLKFKVETFEQLALKVISVIGDNYKGKLFRGKIILNNKNFTTFPNYIPFIENMETLPSKLKMGTDDKVVKSKADVVYTTQSNPFIVEEPTNVDASNIASPVGDINTLPF